jgi:signal transduction histidine kinase
MSDPRNLTTPTKPATVTLWLWLFSGVTIMAIITQCSWAIWQDQKLTVSSEYQNGLIAARLLDEHATQTIREAENSLRTVVHEIRQAGMSTLITDQIIREILTKAQPFNQVMKALQFVTPRREAWVNTIDYPAYQTDADDRTYISQLLAEPASTKTVIGQPFQRFYDGELIVPIAMNVHSVQGDYLGIISTDISVSYFSSVYQRVAQDSDAMVSLFTADGVIIVRFPLDTSLIGQRLADNQLLQSLANRPAEGMFEDRQFLDQNNTNERYYTYRKIADYPIVTVFAREKQDVLAPFYERSKERVWIAAATVIFVLLLTVLLWRYIAKLHQSESMLRRVELEIRSLNAGLEQKVSERTASLATANADLEKALSTLQRMQEEMFRTEKMAALGFLVAGISHELNTPIGNCLMVASTLKERCTELQAEIYSAQPRRSVLVRLLDESAQGSDIIEKSLHRAAQLIQSFKQVSVDQVTDHRRSFDLQEVLKEVVLTLEPTCKRNRHQLICQLEAGIIMEGYPGALAQIITNFVNNAILHAFSDTQRGEMRLQTRQLPEGKVEIIFSDNGVGINPQHQNQVFDPFFTTRLGQGGSGLGLHIVYNLVTTGLNGTISLESELKQGTQFRIVIPQIAPSLSKAAPQGAAAGDTMVNIT